MARQNQQEKSPPKVCRVKVHNSLADLVDLPDPHIWKRCTSDGELLSAASNLIRAWLLVRFRRPGFLGFCRESPASPMRCVLISSRSLLVVYAKENKQKGYVLKLDRADSVLISRPNLQGEQDVTIKWSFGEVTLSCHFEVAHLWQSRILAAVNGSDWRWNNNFPLFGNSRAVEVIDNATQTDNDAFCTNPQNVAYGEIASIISMYEQLTQDQFSQSYQSTQCSSLSTASSSTKDANNNERVRRANPDQVTQDQFNQSYQSTQLAMSTASSSTKDANNETILQTFVPLTPENDVRNEISPNTPPKNLKTDLMTAISKVNSKPSGRLHWDFEVPAFTLVKRYGFGFSTEEVFADEFPLPPGKASKSHLGPRFVINFGNTAAPLINERHLMPTSEIMQNKMSELKRTEADDIEVEHQPDSHEMKQKETTPHWNVNNYQKSASNSESKGCRVSGYVVYYHWGDDEVEESNA